MMGERYIFLNLVLCLQDLHLVDLEDFKYAGTNLTAFRLVDPDNADVRVSMPGLGRGWRERVEARAELSTPHPR